MNTRPLLACLVLMFCASVPVAAGDAEIKKAAKAQATECQNALLKGDYDKLADMTHPKVVAGVGGRKKMVETAAAAVRGLKAKGVTFKSVTIHNPLDPVLAGKDLYILGPFTLEMTLPDGRAAGKSALLGFSGDGGKTWTFADTSPGREAVKKFLPDLPDKLVFPKKEPPMLIKD